jgi:hypothetical protein
MAIGPISGPGSVPPVLPTTTATHKQPAPQHAAATTNVPPSTHIDSVTRTYSEIRIDGANMVSVKVYDADTDQLILEAPPSAIEDLSDTLRQVVAGMVSQQA